MTRCRSWLGRLNDAGARRPPVKPCTYCGRPVRWACHRDAWILFDAAENPMGAWALDGGRAVRVFMAWPGADITRHDRHECEVRPCPPAA